MIFVTDMLLFEFLYFMRNGRYEMFHLILFIKGKEALARLGFLVEAMRIVYLKSSQKIIALNSGF